MFSWNEISYWCLYKHVAAIIIKLNHQKLFVRTQAQIKCLNVWRNCGLFPPRTIDYIIKYTHYIGLTRCYFIFMRLPNMYNEILSPELLYYVTFLSYIIHNIIYSFILFSCSPTCIFWYHNIFEKKNVFSLNCNLTQTNDNCTILITKFQKHHHIINFKERSFIIHFVTIWCCLHNKNKPLDALSTGHKNVFSLRKRNRAHLLFFHHPHFPLCTHTHTHMHSWLNPL